LGLSPRGYRIVFEDEETRDEFIAYLKDIHGGLSHGQVYNTDGFGEVAIAIEDLCETAFCDMVPSATSVTPFYEYSFHCTKDLTDYINSHLPENGTMLPFKDEMTDADALGAWILAEAKKSYEFEHTNAVVTNFDEVKAAFDAGELNATAHVNFEYPASEWADNNGKLPDPLVGEREITLDFATAQKVLDAFEGNACAAHHGYHVYTGESFKYDNEHLTEWMYYWMGLDKYDGRFTVILDPDETGIIEEAKEDYAPEGSGSGAYIDDLPLLVVDNADGSRSEIAEITFHTIKFFPAQGDFYFCPDESPLLDYIMKLNKYVEADAAGNVIVTFASADDVTMENFSNQIISQLGLTTRGFSLVFKDASAGEALINSIKSNFGTSFTTEAYDLLIEDLRETDFYDTPWTTAPLRGEKYSFKIEFVS
ncbi:MAG: hypothetical protein MJ096_02290, partial [Clostridia bacterium]|nr:hypothetical protein [Clostridia bacterium]